MGVVTTVVVVAGGGLSGTTTAADAGAGCSTVVCLKLQAPSDTPSDTPINTTTNTGFIASSPWWFIEGERLDESDRSVVPNSCHVA